MIRLNCTKCAAMLEIDDAFAGGVCRCKHCGTIQTVPKETKRPTSPIGAQERPRALVHKAGSRGNDER